MKTIPVQIKEQKRSCNGCTACCDGWLQGSALGHSFWPGRPCHFITSSGCSVYESRPDTPCKSFHCEWLKNNNIPEWLKPNKSNVIIVAREIDGVNFLSVSEAGGKMPVEVLSWLFMEYASGRISNIMYQIHGYWNYIGSNKFCEIMAKQNK